MKLIDEMINKALLSILIIISRSKHDAPPKKRSKIGGITAFEFRYLVPETPGEFLLYVLCFVFAMLAIVTAFVYIRTAK